MLLSSHVRLRVCSDLYQKGDRKQPYKSRLFVGFVLRFCSMYLASSILHLSVLVPVAIAVHPTLLADTTALQTDFQRNPKSKTITARQGVDSAKKSQHREVQTDTGSIVGGTIVPIGKYPFFATYGCCGATLIRHDILLTAAHCAGCIIENVTKALLNVTNATVGIAHTVKRIFVHPNYDGNTILNDIALLQLSCSSTIKPIALNYNRNMPVTRTKLSVTGFGLREDYDFPDDLYETTETVISNSACSAIFKDFPIKYNSTAMLCSADNGKSACYGDSGGPLFLGSKNKLQVGIVSWGQGCAYLNYPTVYTRISTYRKFILSTIREHSSIQPHYCS